MTPINEQRLAKIEEMVLTHGDRTSRANITTSTDMILDLCAALREAWAERDEAREWVRNMTAKTRTLTCVYCGTAYPPGSPTHGSDVLTEHIRICQKHPMRTAERERDEALALVEMMRSEHRGYSTSPTLATQSLSDLRARIEAEVWREAAELAACCAPPGEWNDPQAHWIACARAIAAEFTRRAERARKETPNA